MLCHKILELSLLLTYLLSDGSIIFLGKSPSIFQLGSVVSGAVFVKKSPSSRSEDQWFNDLTPHELVLDPTESIGKNEGINHLQGKHPDNNHDPPQEQEKKKELVTPEILLPVEDMQAAASAEAPQQVNPLEVVGQGINSFVSGVVGGLTKQSGHVEQTLGSLNRGIENGAQGIQNFIGVVQDLKARGFQAVIERLAGFFNAVVNGIRGFFGVLQNGFQLLLDTFFRRDGKSMPNMDSAPPLDNSIVQDIQPPSIQQ